MKEKSLIFLIKNVSKIYHDGTSRCIALDHVSFSTPQKGIFAIVGKSGSGKSTLLNVLSLLEATSSGSISYLGKELGKLNRKERLSLRNREFGFIHQGFNLLEEEDVLYNVSLPLLLLGVSKKESERRVKEVLLSLGLSECKSKKVEVLSGGEKQRVAIARAIVKGNRVIFADEPTGALDEKNGVAVMELLKRISKNTLVILVSHNEALVERYADHCLYLEDGKILGKADSFSFTSQRLSLKSHPSFSSWRKPLLHSHLRKDKKKNVLSLLSGVVAFSALLLGVGFTFGSKESLEIEQEKSLLLYSASVSMVERHEIEGSPLSLLRSSRPNREEIEDALLDLGISVHNDYSFFFPHEAVFTSSDLSSSSSFEPIFDPSLKELGKSFLKEGEGFKDNENGCFVNEEFVNAFSLKLGSKIEVPLEINFEIENKSYLLPFYSEFLIKGVVKEFSFLNLPRVYYSYGFYEERLKEKEYEPSKNIWDYLENASKDDAMASFSYRLFAHDEKGKEALFELAKGSEGQKEGLLYSSLSYSTISSFSSLHEALSMLLFPFLVLTLIGASFIVGSISYSSFLERKKEAAILISLGGAFRDVVWLYLEGTSLLSLVSMTASFVLSLPLSEILNALLYRWTSLPSLIQIPYSRFLGVPFSLILFGILLALALAFMGTILPLLTFKRKSLLTELNDE